MKMKRLLTFVIAFALVLALVPCAFAASDKAAEAANALYELGLFNGTGTDENGDPIFELDRAPTRHEAVTMLVRLLGQTEAAASGAWEMPFTDVADWAKPYVGYAYTNGLTAGTSADTYSGDLTVTATQYLTFVLRALGYESGTDFPWDRAWELSDRIGLTNGEYNEDTELFTRGDVAIVSYAALTVNKKDSNATIADELGISLEPKEPGLSDILNGHYWVGKNGGSETFYVEVYYFEGNTFSCVYKCFKTSTEELVFSGYQTGTYTVSGTELTLTSQKDYTLISGASVSVLDDEPSNNAYTVTVSSESSIKLNSWGYTINDELAGSFETVKNDVTGKYRSTDSEDYTYLAQADFRTVHSKYDTATAQCAYVYAFTNAKGEFCVLVDLRYKIISNFSVFKLHNLTTGQTITDPDDYYNNLANRAYGASKIQYMELANEITGLHMKMLQAMKTVLEGGTDTWTGAFVDAATLSM